MVNRISATKARSSFAEIINRVQYQGEEYVVEKQGKPVAVIVQTKKSTNDIPPTKRRDGNVFLAKLATYTLRGAPTDLAKEHDKYTWEQ